MAMDIAILAIPGLGTTKTSQILCSCSILLGVGCIFANTVVQHFGTRMRSMDFAVRFALSFCKPILTLPTSQAYYLRRKTKIFIVITGIPTSFCVLR
jgi:hypothetical protein